MSGVKQQKSHIPALRFTVLLVDLGCWGWVRVAIDEPSDEPLRKGETQRTKPFVGPHVDWDYEHCYWWDLVIIRTHTIHEFLPDLTKCDQLSPSVVYIIPLRASQ